MPILCRHLAAALLAAALVGCASWSNHSGRWIAFDPQTQRYSVHAEQVARGDLLDELKKVSGAEVRPQRDREARLTLKAQGLDLEAMVAMLVPEGTRPIIRPGERDMAAAAPAGAERLRPGEPSKPIAGAVAKPEPKADADRPSALPKPGGALKPDAKESLVQREPDGPGTKPRASTLVRVADKNEPKRPHGAGMPRETVRLQIEFAEGAAPRLIDARRIEGRVPRQRIVTGSFVFVLLGADGRVLELGTFQDPLVQHSYLPSGVHSVGAARTGIAGLSVGGDNLSRAVLRIVDMTGLPMPRELDDAAAQIALERGKTVLQIDSPAIQRLLEQEPKR